MGISREDVMRVARLAQIELTEAEAAELPEQLDRIVEHVRSLESVALGEGDEAAGPRRAEPPPREDRPEPSLTNDEALREAPARRGEFFGVPRVIGAEE